MPPSRKRARRPIPPPTGCGSEHETESSDGRTPADVAPKAKARAKQRTAKAKAKPKAKTAAKARPKRQRTVRAKAKPRPTSSSESTPSDTSSSSETTSGYAEAFGERVQTSPRSMDLDSDTIPDLEVQLDMSDRPQVPPAPPPAPLPWQREVAILAPSRDDDDGCQQLHIPRMARAGRAAAKMLCRAKLRCTCHFEYAWLCPDRLP